MQQAIRTIKEAAGKFVEGAAKGVTTVAAGATMMAGQAVGGTIKHTIKGIGAGIEAASGLQKRFLGDAAEAAAKGTDDVVEAATQRVQYGRNKLQGGGYEYYREVDGVRQTIDSAAYGKQRGQYIASQRSKNPNYDPNSNYSWNFNMEEQVSQAANVAQEAAESGAGFFSGIQEWAQQNTALAGAIAVGTGVAGGALLFGGDDDY